jgi:hypothetical protein
MGRGRGKFWLRWCRIAFEVAAAEGKDNAETQRTPSSAEKDFGRVCGGLVGGMEWRGSGRAFFVFVVRMESLRWRLRREIPPLRDSRFIYLGPRPDGLG